MIDVKHLAENPELYRASQRARDEDETLVDQIIAADADRRAALQRFESLRAEQNVLSKKIGPAKGDEKQALLEKAKELAANVKAAEAEADAKGQELAELNNRFPNLIIEGISLIATERAEIGAMLEAARGSIDGLIQTLRARA